VQINSTNELLERCKKLAGPDEEKDMQGSIFKTKSRLNNIMENITKMDDKFSSGMHQ
jgi:hypothetical protein